MTEKELFHIIHQCSDSYLEETIKDKKEKQTENAGAFHSKRKRSIMRSAAAAAACILFLGAGISVAASASETFREWIQQIFRPDTVQEIHMTETAKNKESSTAAEKRKENTPIFLEENMQILGEKETFISEYHFEGENNEEIVDHVYTIENNDMIPLEISSFQGAYDEVPFSFDYATINEEIYTFNYKGDVDEVFHHIEGDIIYAALCNIKEIDEEQIVDKECLASLNLKTGEVRKLTGDNTICNFIMSPNGKVILCNHRSEAYWSVFDLASDSEKKVKDIGGYNRASEIYFLDDYHILTLGKSFMKEDMEWYNTYLIDLHTRKIIDEFEDNGEINMEWSYTYDKDHLKIYDITNDNSFTINQIEDNLHPISVRGDYVIFGNLEDAAAFYLVNLAHQSFMKIDVPKELFDTLEIHLVSNEDKILITNGTEIYLIDISTL